MIRQMGRSSASPGMSYQSRECQPLPATNTSFNEPVLWEHGRRFKSEISNQLAFSFNGAVLWEHGRRRTCPIPPNPRGDIGGVDINWEQGWNGSLR